MKKTNLTKPNRLKCILLLFPLALSVLACSDRTKNSTDIPGPETVLKLKPSENNPRNSEGDFVSLKDGRILYIYSHFCGNSSSDYAPASLAARFSSDRGKTWTKKDKTVIPIEAGLNAMSVSLLRLKNGDIALFYLAKNSHTDCTPQICISKNEAQSWSDPVPVITDKKGYFVLNNDRVIQLESGRLILAVALHRTPGAEWHNKGDLYCYFSDDNGQTWLSGDKVPDTTDIITQEPGLIEMKDGKLMMYARANGGFQQLSYSSDQGESWSHIETSNIRSPLSPATIEKLPGSGDWLLVWNNNDCSDPGTKKHRTPLTVAISKDEGKTWGHVKNIHDDPDGWYCYTAIHFIDEDNFLLSYCAGSSSQRTHLSVTDIAMVKKPWLYK